MRTFLSLAILFGAFLGGCASSSPPAADGKPHGQCLVCKHNADLACVDIVVDDSTPRRVRDGQTYYFCSEECAKAFDKDPTTYCLQKK
jgi:YHS domain-containing protein